MYKWTYKWVIGVITLLNIGVITPVITGTGPTLYNMYIYILSNDLYTSITTQSRGPLNRWYPEVLLNKSNVLKGDLDDHDLKGYLQEISNRTH